MHWVSSSVLRVVAAIAVAFAIALAMRSSDANAQFSGQFRRADIDVTSAELDQLFLELRRLTSIVETAQRQPCVSRETVSGYSIALWNAVRIHTRGAYSRPLRASVEASYSADFRGWTTWQKH
jgi:hypothetical protein